MKRFVVLLALFCLASPLAAGDGQAADRTDDQAASRPKIGLALSGGGARGLAHVGVLRVLEDHRVPIDYIAGISMGAVIGGLYASGMPADEIERRLAAIDWRALLRNGAPRRDLSYRRKFDDNRYLFDLEVGLKDGRMIVPPSLVSSQRIDVFLRMQALPVAEVNDFSRLPIPFRAVAADLVSGDIINLDSGELSEAIRASLAIPGVFAPVSIGDWLLADPGLVDNLPVTAVRDMGADIVIAVDVSSPLLTEDKLSEMGSVAVQALSLATEQNLNEERAGADLLITPELTAVAPWDYDNAPEIVASGLGSAGRYSDRLAELSDPEIFERQQRMRKRPPLPVFVPAQIRIEGAELLAVRRIEQRIETKVGEPVDFARLEQDLDAIFQLDVFESVGFELEAGDRPTLVFKVVEKTWGPRFLRLGATIEGDLEGDDQLALLVNYTHSLINPRGAEWRTDLQIGETWRLFSELYQPLTVGGEWFLAPSIEVYRRLEDLYRDGNEIAELRVRRAYLGGDLGRRLSDDGEVRLGIRRGWVETSFGGAIDSLADEAEIGAVQASLVIDRLDSADVARHGMFARLDVVGSLEDLGAEDIYTRLSGSLRKYGTRGRHTGFVALEAGGRSGSRPLPIYDDFRLGGLMSLSGFAHGELRGQYLGVARAGYLYRFFDLPQGVGTAVYLGGWIEAGNVWQDRDDVGEDLITAASIALAAESRLGPMYFTYGWADQGSGRIALLIGNRF